MDQTLVLTNLRTLYRLSYHIEFTKLKYACNCLDLDVMSYWIYKVQICLL